jgi:hypothetical protein
MNIFITKDSGFISQNGQAGTDGCDVSALPANLSSLSWDDSTNTGKVEFDHGVIQHEITSESDIKTHLGINLVDILKLKSDRDAQIIEEKKIPTERPTP